VLLVAEVFEAASKMGTVRDEIRRKVLAYHNDREQKDSATESFTDATTGEMSSERWKVLGEELYMLRPAFLEPGVNFYIARRVLDERLCIPLGTSSLMRKAKASCRPRISSLG
jgi:hypothetical protein